MHKNKNKICKTILLNNLQIIMLTTNKMNKHSNKRFIILHKNQPKEAPLA